MSQEHVEVTDLYESAYLLNNGCHLEEVDWEKSRSHAVFTLTGEGIKDHIDAFRSGNATGNICLYLFTLERLKDRLFSEQRQRGERGARR